MRRAVVTIALMALAAAPAMADPFTLTSPDIAPGPTIPSTFVYCGGANVSPALSWSGAPKGTKSFVLTVYDPDAPTGSGFWHWVMYDIPASVDGLARGAGVPGKQPAGAVQGATDYGAPGYGGPCPPEGDPPHHYVFTLYAVKTDKLDVSGNPTAAVVGFHTHFVTIGKATFTALFGR
jgi:Raf kinase inhibitor-like YbhB/YbcL family protein